MKKKTRKEKIKAYLKGSLKKAGTSAKVGVRNVLGQRPGDEARLKNLIKTLDIPKDKKNFNYVLKDL